MLGAAFGDYPRLIAAPLDIGDCFTLIPEIFNLADRFQVPGMRFHHGATLGGVGVFVADEDAVFVVLVARDGMGITGHAGNDAGETPLS